MMLGIFVVTKDRPLQFEACVRSIKQFIRVPSYNIYALIKSSSSAYQDAYIDVLYEHPCIIDIEEEGDFRGGFFETLGHLSKSCDFVLGMTDDTLMYRETPDLSCIDGMFENPDLFSVSLRLGQNTTQQNVENSAEIIHVKPPTDIGYSYWNWRNENPNNNLGYPISLDGHIYRAKELLELSGRISFHNLRSWEGELVGYVQRVNKTIPSYMAAFEKSSCVNLAINMVQEPYHSKVGPHGTSIEELLNLYNSNYRISLYKTFEGVEINGSHMYLPLKYMSR